MNVRVRVRENTFQEEKENNLNKEENVFSISPEIQKIIDERGFYLHEWINLYYILNSLVGIFFISATIVCCFIGTFLMIITSGRAFFIIFFVCLPISYIILVILYFLYILKNKYVIITNKYILLNGKSIDLRRKELINEYIQYLGKKVDNDDFYKITLKKYNSLITKIKDTFNKGVIEKSGLFFTIYVRTCNIIMLGLFLIVYLLLYPISFFIFWLRNRNLFLINKLFEKIDKNSEKLLKTKKEIMLNLLKAKNNEWKDGLLLEINRGLSKIGKLSKTCIKESEKLRKVIQNSKYNYMYDFDIYNKRIKKQIYNPINEIEKLLEVNKKSLYKSKGDVLEKIEVVKRKDQEEIMKLQNTRLNMNIEQIEKNLQLIRSYREKLEADLNS